MQLSKLDDDRVDELEGEAAYAVNAVDEEIAEQSLEIGVGAGPPA